MSWFAPVRDAGLAVVERLDWKQSVRAATTANLVATYVAGVLTADANGSLDTLAPDGVVGWAVNQRIGVIAQAGAQAKYDGIYVVVDVGADDPGGRPFILRRSTDADTSEKVQPGFAFEVEEGAFYGPGSGRSLVRNTNTGTIVLDTTLLTWGPLALLPAAHAATHLPAGSDPLTYAPAVGGDYSPAVMTPNGALDQLAARSALTRIASPAAFGGAQSDVDFGAALDLVRCDLSADASITGMVPGLPKTIVNIDPTFNLTLTHQDAASAAANRWTLPSLVAFVIPPGGAVQCWYDTASTTWRVLGAAT